MRKLSLNRNYFRVTDPKLAETIVPHIDPLESIDHGLNWVIGVDDGIQLADGDRYRVTSSSGQNMGLLEPLHRDDTTWGVFRPLSPGTVNITLLAENGEVTDECVH